MSRKPRMDSARTLALIAAVALAAFPAAGAENAFTQTNLVSDIPDLAKVLDPNLVNPWGIAFSPTSPFWIANNHTGTATLYNGMGQPFPLGQPLVVTIPPPENGTPPASPTGTVFNGTGKFDLQPGKPALFLFATEDGTISGWNPMVNQTNAILKVDNSRSGAVYKGLALGGTESRPLLYATNFFAGTVDVFNTSFEQISVNGGFRDEDIPEGFAPFGIRAFREKLYITYAKQDDAKHDDVAGPGNGFVDVFNMNGHLLRRLISGGKLNSPWGLAFAPKSFGEFGHDLLVGNFGDGRIHAFGANGEFAGTLRLPSEEPVTILGLWSLTFGNGGNGGDPNVLFFTAGIPGPGGQLEDHGLFGSLSPARAHEHREEAR